VVLEAVAVGLSLHRRFLVLRVMVAISVLAVDRIYGDERFPTISVSCCTGSVPLCSRLD
jgi:hypothetical protein